MIEFDFSVVFLNPSADIAIRVYNFSRQIFYYFKSFSAHINKCEYMIDISILLEKINMHITGLGENLISYS